MKTAEFMNIRSLEKTAVIAYFEQHTSDTSWLYIIRKAIDWCDSRIEKNLERFQKFVTLPKNECDAKFYYYFVCLQIYSALVSLEYCEIIGFLGILKVGIL